MRVLYVVHNFPPYHWAGTEVYTYNIAKGMLQKGHDVDVYCWEYLDGGKEYHHRDEDYEGLRVRRVLRDEEKFTLMEHENREIEGDFRRLLSERDYDVAHITHLFGLSVNLVHILGEKDIPTVLTLPDYWFICPNAHFLYDIKEIEELTAVDFLICDKLDARRCAECLTPRKRKYIKERTRAIVGMRPRASEIWDMIRERAWRRLEWDLRFALYSVSEREIIKRADRCMDALNRADLVIAPSRFIKRKYQEHGLKKARYSDYGMNKFQPRPLSKDKLRFAFIGTPVRHKGLHVLLRAWSLLQPGLKGAELLLFGDIDRQPYYSRQVRVLMEGLEGVREMGAFKNTQLPEVMSGFEVLVVPSIWYENSPLVIHEAFIARRPVIASDIGGMKELLEKGGGLCFGVGDHEDLAEKMSRFIDDRELVERTGDEVPEVKSVEENVDELLVIYHGLRSGSQDRRE